MELLPANFDSMVSDAVASFWRTRGSSTGTGQDGNRGSVIAGKNLDGFAEITRQVAQHCGLPKESVLTSGRTALNVPGYFRATKSWDTLVIHRGRLIAAFEFKSHVGPSFGNNFNNRTEEALGNALDLKEAYNHGVFEISTSEHVAADAGPPLARPFRGYLMLLEDCKRSNTPVGISSPHFPTLPEFKGSSYTKRYELLCERLVEEELYDAAALACSERVAGANGVSHSPTAATSIRNLYAQFAGRAAAAMAMY